MLFSMTGFGDARATGKDFSVGIEIRSVNNRHLKLSVRGTDPYPLMENDLEKIVRKYVRRGSLLLHIRVDRSGESSDLKLNTAALTAYLRQLKIACDDAGTPELLSSVAVGVLSLPGVAADGEVIGGPPDHELPVVEATLVAALEKFDKARRKEGQAMADELLQYNRLMASEITKVRELMPRVMSDYRQRILERVRQATASANVQVDPESLIREVAIFADRTDVAEEVTRFSAHLDQFSEIIKTGAEGAGRRLEFVVQEMGREVNTMGSKAGDVTISRHVVEIKSTLEKIRELIQNVE